MCPRYRRSGHGLPRVNRTLRDLGLANTRLPSSLEDLLGSIAADAGSASRWELTDAISDPTRDSSSVDQRIATGQALQPSRCFPTTAADMARLLCLIWRDQPGPPRACGRLRRLMAAQVTRHRLASAFPRQVSVAAKSGSLGGVIRNEIGVIQLPNGRRLAAAVFTRARHRRACGSSRWRPR